MLYETTSTFTDADASDKQRRFCELIQDYRSALMRYTNEPNRIKRAEARNSLGGAAGGRKEIGAGLLAGISGHQARAKTLGESPASFR